MESRRSESRGLSCSGWAGPSFPPGPVPICDEKLGQVGARERGPAGSGWRGQDQFQDAIFLQAGPAVAQIKNKNFQSGVKAPHNKLGRP